MAQGVYTRDKGLEYEGDIFISCDQDVKGSKGEKGSLSSLFCAAENGIQVCQMRWIRSFMVVRWLLRMKVYSSAYLVDMRS